MADPAPEVLAPLSDGYSDLEHGIFTRGGGGGVVEAVIVAVTWVFAVTALRFVWTRRGQLLGGGPDAGQGGRTRAG